MFKTVASIVACVALMGLVQPATAQMLPSSTGGTVAELCKKGDKDKDKGVEKPAASDGVLSLCKKDGKKKGGQRGEAAPAE